MVDNTIKEAHSVTIHKQPAIFPSASDNAPFLMGELLFIDER